MLLSGLLLGIDPDPYPFWHSSQAQGGRNLAGYANRKADELLEKARTTTDPSERQTLYRSFQELLDADVPALFLYQSTYPYAVSSKIKLTPTTRIITPSDRFAGIASWYIETKRSLKF